jgi:nicotinate-nucleotide pyrophosphorylase (carboxylating)
VDAAAWIDLYLKEDLGRGGDITSHGVLKASDKGAARIVAREPCCLAGVTHADTVFSRCGATLKVHMNDGSWIEAGTVVATVTGPARAILTGERLALNLLGRMSGVASLTRQAMDALARAGSAAVVAATRKTTPGFRRFEKEAVAIGGGDPHRAGLWDAAMVKDNHLAAANAVVARGDIEAAVERIRFGHPRLEVTVEAESLEVALSAAMAGADWILIDNQPPDVGAAWAQALAGQFPAVRVEASGGITLATVTAYGWAHRISMGSLTQGVRSMDFSLEWGA